MAILHPMQNTFFNIQAPPFIDQMIILINLIDINDQKQYFFPLFFSHCPHVVYITSEWTLNSNISVATAFFNILSTSI